jgi:hypothetical protein
MNTSSWLLAVVGIASALPAFASDRFNMQNGSSAATTAETVGSGPLRHIYRVAGVRDDGQTLNQGVATTFLCTNRSAVAESISFRIYNYDGATVRISTYSVGPQRTFTASTHATAQFSEDALLTPGAYIDQGSAVIAATSSNLHCTALIASASSAEPIAAPLHLVRVNIQPGTVE